MNVFKIHLEDLEFTAFHGVYEKEKNLGNKFLVNVWLDAEVNEDAYLDDDLSGTLNYEIIFNIVKEEIKIPSDLLEHAVYRIAKKIEMEVVGVSNYKIELKKLSPPFDGKAGGVSVVLEGTTNTH